MPRHNINFSINQSTVNRDKKILLVLFFSMLCLSAGVYDSEQTLKSTREERIKVNAVKVNVPNVQSVPKNKTLNAFWLDSKANWSALFTTFEELKNPDITLLSVEPRLTEQQVYFSGLAKDQEALNLYLTKLESSPAFKQVELQRYKRTSRSPNGLEFFAVMQWSAYE